MKHVNSDMSSDVSSDLSSSVNDMPIRLKHMSIYTPYSCGDIQTRIA
jgi:hypothetical protein